MHTFIKNKTKGFSLLELLVVISIFTIITTIALFNQGQLNSNVLLTNLAYDVALTVREVQSYGVGVKYSDIGSGADGGYGIYMNILEPDIITVFQDGDANGIFGLDEEIKTYQFSNQRGNKIAELCAIGVTPGGPICVGSGESVSSMSITFKRPDPEANFYGGRDTFTGPAYIVLKSQDGTNCRAFVVEASGQIRVEGSDSPAC